MSDSLRPHSLQPARLLHPWDFHGKSTGVGCHFLLQGFFLTQGLNPAVLPWQVFFFFFFFLLTEPSGKLVDGIFQMRPL